MKTKVKKTATLTEAQFAQLLGKKDISVTVDNGYSDQRDGYCASPKTITLSWYEEEELKVTL